MEVILFETPGGMKGEYLFKLTLLGKPLSGGFKVKGNFRLSSAQEIFYESKLLAAPMDKRVCNPRTQRKLMSSPKANERIKGPRPFTM